MVERHRGEKSYVRIAKSSKEQDGYERHRTRPVPASCPGPVRRPSATAGVATKKLEKRYLVSRGGTKFFRAGAAAGQATGDSGRVVLPVRVACRVFVRIDPQRQ